MPNLALAFVSRINRANAASGDLVGDGRLNSADAERRSFLEA
jgi:hypothetical protein